MGNSILNHLSPTLGRLEDCYASGSGVTHSTTPQETDYDCLHYGTPENTQKQVSADRDSNI